MEQTSHPSWPLQAGHLYGANTADLRHHTGRESFTDRRMLAVWQRAYSERHAKLLPTGVFDGTTQAAVIHVQKLSGLPVTGCLDRETWVALWTVGGGKENPLPTQNQPTSLDSPPTAMVKRKTVRPDRKRQHWRRYSQAGLDYATTPNAPVWYPGKPFGPNELGWHVSRCQEILGDKPTGRFTQSLARKVRGIQRLHDLPVSGIVDSATALAIDPTPVDLDTA